MTCPDPCGGVVPGVGGRCSGGGVGTGVWATATATKIIEPTIMVALNILNVLISSTSLLASLHRAWFRLGGLRSSTLLFLWIFPVLWIESSVATCGECRGNRCKPLAGGRVTAAVQM